MRKLIILVWLMIVATNAMSAPKSGKKAFGYYSCNQCHSAGSIAISPAQITAKYQGNQGSYGYLLNELKKGGFDKGKISHDRIINEMQGGELESVVEWLVGNKDISTYTASQDSSSATAETNTGSSTSKAETSSGSAVLGAAGAILGVYLENQEAKTNSRNRNSGSSQPAVQARTQATQNNSSRSGKSYIIDEASHCLQVISAVDERRCGRPGGYEFTVKNSCPEQIKFSLQTWKTDGRFNLLSVGTIEPRSTNIMWGCDLNGQYGKYMSACYTRSWLKTCRALTDSDYDENGNLITQ